MLNSIHDKLDPFMTATAKREQLSIDIIASLQDTVDDLHKKVGSLTLQTATNHRATIKELEFRDAADWWMQTDTIHRTIHHVSTLRKLRHVQTAPSNGMAHAVPQDKENSVEGGPLETSLNANVLNGVPRQINPPDVTTQVENNGLVESIDEPHNHSYGTNNPFARLIKDQEKRRHTWSAKASANSTTHNRDYNTGLKIPTGRTLMDIDQLISRSVDESEINELKQQQRLLRNRQAALDSRQRKKQHTERLEQEKRVLEDEKKSLEERNKGLGAEKQDLQEHTKNLEEQKNNLEAQKKNLEEQNKGLEEERELDQSTIAALKTQLKEMSQREEEMRQQLTSVTSQRDLYHTRLMNIGGILQSHVFDAD